MKRALIRSLIPVLLCAATAIPLAAVEPPANRKAFLFAWENRTVILAQPLYSIVYDEGGVLPSLFTRDNRVRGLTVGTPDGTYYQFESRRNPAEDITDPDPKRVLTTLQEKYRHSGHLGSNPQQVEPLTLVRYEPGVVMYVAGVQIEGDRVRLMLHRDRRSDLATTITVRWSSTLSDALTESPQIWEVLKRYVTRI